MRELFSRIQLLKDKAIVISYTIFVVALIIVYPARTIETIITEYRFGQCVGEWNNALGAIECSSLTVENAPNNMISGSIHISGTDVGASETSTSSISVAAVEDPIEIPLEEVAAPPPEQWPPAEVDTSATSSPITEDLPVMTTTTLPMEEVVPETPTAPVTQVIAESPWAISVQYIFEGGEWKTAGVIENSTEKKYSFPINFEGVTHENLPTLRVRLVGQSENSQHSYYIDRVWVSIESTKQVEEITVPEIANNVAIDQSVVSDKKAAPVFEGVVIENPAMIIPAPEPVIVDPEARHVCEFADYHVRLGSVVGAQTSVDVLLSGLAAASSTIHAARIPEGLSFAFENGLDELNLSENQISAKMSIAVTQEIEPRSFNVPIVYSLIRSDLAKSSSLCHLNVIVE
jgi:hypothetical protein